MKVKVINARREAGLSVTQMQALEAFNQDSTVATFRELYVALFARFPSGDESFFDLNEQVANRLREYAGEESFRNLQKRARFSARTLFAYIISASAGSMIIEHVAQRDASPAWMLVYVGFWIPAIWSQWKDHADGE